MEDTFKQCPHCGSQLCYTQQVDGEESHICMSCGYTSTSLMKEGSDTEKAVTEKQPKIYQELKFVDNDGYVWYPAVIAVPEKGMVYVDIVDGDWKWAAAPARKLTPKETRMKKFKGRQYVTEADKATHFNKEMFFEAAVSIGMFS